MVILAALLRRGGEARAERDELRMREGEARELFREVVLPRRERRAPGRTGDLLAGELVAVS